MIKKNNYLTEKDMIYLTNLNSHVPYKMSYDSFMETILP